MDQQPTQPESQIDETEIKMDELIADWGRAKTYTDNYTRDFPSLDNLVDGVPVAHQKDSPYVGDTTLAGLVRSIPRDSLQQLPIFAAVVNGSKKSVDAYIASYILRKGVFNQDTFGKGLLSTLQIGAEQAITHGYASFMTATGSMFDEFGTTMRVLHYADCAPEPGIQDANESGFFYVTANLTQTRVRKIYNAAKNNPSTSWNVEALKRLLDMQPTVNNYSIYQSDAKAKTGAENAPQYQFVTKYEVGKNGQFITFCPQIEDIPLRVIDNKSKFGFPRVQFLVIDPAALSPFGTSRVRLSSPNQNLMNAYYQNIASTLLLNSKPPLLVRGRFLKPVQLKQNARWEARDQNAKAELVQMDNGSLQWFGEIDERISAKINTMMGKPNKTSGVGNTAPGVKQQIRIEDNSTNQITNILENFTRQYALTALDTYIAEQTVDNYDPENPILDTLVLDDEAKEAINRIGQDNFEPSEEQPVYVPLVGDDNVLKVDWNKYYDAIKMLGVEIELSMGKDELEEKTRQDLQDQLVVMTQNLPDPSDPNYAAARAKISEIEDRLLSKTIPESKRMAPYTPPAPTPQQPVQTEISPEVSQSSMSS